MLRIIRKLWAGHGEPSNQERFVAILASTRAVSKPSRGIRLRQVSEAARANPMNEARMKLQRILEKA